MNTELNQTTPLMPEQEQAFTAPVQSQAHEPVGFWIFLGLIALFSIPVVGFISAIIFMFAPKKKSIRNFAGAVMTWMVVGIVTTVLTVTLVLGVLGNLILPAINEQFGSEIGNIYEVFGMAADVKNGNYSNVISFFRGPILEAIGEEYAPLLDEFSTGKYDEIIDQIKNEEYDKVLEDLQSGKYQDLVNKLDPEDYKELRDELQAAANGEPSEVFDGLKTFLNDSPISGLDLLQ